MKNNIKKLLPEKAFYSKTKISQLKAIKKIFLANLIDKFIKKSLG